jgi:excisionase family DNA binding protein
MVAAVETSARLLTAREAEKYLSVSPRKLWEMKNTGEIPCVRLGRALRYDRQQIDAWIDRQKGS